MRRLVEVRRFGIRSGSEEWGSLGYGLFYLSFFLIESAKHGVMSAMMRVKGG